MPASTLGIFALVCLLAGFGLSWAAARAARWRVCHLLLLGVWIAQAVVLQLDWQKDPTDHNLFPFEFVGLAIVASPAYVAAALARPR